MNKYVITLATVLTAGLPLTPAYTVERPQATCPLLYDPCSLVVAQPIWHQPDENPRQDQMPNFGRPVAGVTTSFAYTFTSVSSAGRVFRFAPS